MDAGMKETLLPSFCVVNPKKVDGKFHSTVYNGWIWFLADSPSDGLFNSFDF